MSEALRLILFDVDGTLVDSQGHIVASMEAAFREEGLAAPDRAQILGIVGLSLEPAMIRLAPGAGAGRRARLVAAYRRHYAALRREAGAAAASPLYPGVAEMLRALAAEPFTLLGVATGKSARGLEAVLDAHGLGPIFVTRQVADHHPSKPHPSMIHAAMSETGVGRGRTVMVGDTSFDLDMARAAGVRSVAVAWGYHPAEALAGADCIAHAPADLLTALAVTGKAAA